MLRSFKSNSYMTGPTSNVGTGVAVTASIMVYPVVFSGDGAWFAKWNTGLEWILGDNGSICFAGYGNGSGGGLAFANGTLPPLRMWSNATIRVNPIDRVYLSIRGAALANTLIGNHVASSDPVTIGNTTNVTSDTHMWYAHAAIWDTFLTDAEVAMLQYLPPHYVRPASLVSYWPLTDPAQPGKGYPRRYGGNQDMRVVGVNPNSVVDEFDPFGLTAYPLGLPEIAIAGPTILAPEFVTVGVVAYEPSFGLELPVDFVTVGVQPKPVFLSDQPLPPFVPPSLPPTIPAGSPEGPGVPLPPLSSGGLGGIRFYQGPPWRWVVTDLETNTLTFLDRLAFDATVTYGLNQGSTAKLSVPSDNPEVNILHTDGEPFVSEGNRLLYGFRREGWFGEVNNWVVRFAGKILQVEDSGEAENARTIITAYDPWHLLYQRPMVNEDGLFPDTAGFFSFDDTQVGNICLIFLRNTILNHGIGEPGQGLGIDTGDGPFPGAEPGNLPGTPYWGGIYENTTQRDTKCQQGLMVGEVWDQQLDTGALDILLTPIYDPVNRPGYMADLRIVEEAGSLKEDAIFAWDKPSRNLRGINRIKDGTKRANTIRYYYGQGGPPSGGGIPLSYGPSILKYGETWHQQFWPDRDDDVVNALAQLQLDLMQDGVTTVSMTPAPERMPFLFREFWLGDLVPVYASNKLRAPVAGVQRIYGVVLSIDENSYEQVPQILVSANDL